MKDHRANAQFSCTSISSTDISNSMLNCSYQGRANSRPASLPFKITEFCGIKIASSVNWVIQPSKSPELITDELLANKALIASTSASMSATGSSATSSPCWQPKLKQNRSRLHIHIRKSSEKSSYKFFFSFSLLSQSNVCFV